MTFTRQYWEQQTKKQYKKLNQLAAWLRQQANPVGVMAYSAIATFTIWPLVEAVTTTATSGQPLPIPVITAVGAIIGNLGSNLLANQIQNWYDAASNGQSPTQKDVLAWVQQNVPQKADLKEEIDTVLQELQAIPRAQAVVAQTEDWQTLAQALHSEMQRLGNLPRFQAHLEGSGVIMQGTNQRLAQDGSAIVEGDIHRDLVMRQTINQNMDPTQMEPDALRAAYLTRLLDERNQLLLGGIDPKAATNDSERLALSAVYTALLTETSERTDNNMELKPERATQQPRRLSALAQLNQHQHLVLLGDPGSGKSTFVNFVAVCLAGEELAQKQLNIKLMTQPLPPDADEQRRLQKEKEEPQPQPWHHGAILPVCIVLRDFAARGLPAAGQKATAAHLWRFITAELEKAALAEYAPLLKKELLEKGGLFLFDGLDEVPTGEEHRIHIKQVVEDVAKTYQHCRILVTSRTYAYQHQDWRLPTFSETVLAPFSRGQIEQFVDRWYDHVRLVRHLNESDAQGRAALLKQAIFGSKRLYDLAERPLLLTLMASLHAWRGGSLPDNREELYADAVELLLEVWERQRIVRAADGEVQVIQPSLEQWLQIDRGKVRGLLNKLAYDAHSSQPDLVGTADIAEADLVLGLLALSEAQNLQPKQLVSFLSYRAGLLLPRGVGVYTYPHRTFQEYLAACHLTEVGYPHKVAQLARQDPNRWREVALLAGAKAARGSSYALWGLVEELCHCQPEEGNEADYWGAHLAGQFLAETADLTQATAAQQQHVNRIRNWLVQVITKPRLPATERALAGRHLAQLGDPRPEVINVDAMQLCFVPPGEFIMGEDEDEHPQNCLDYGYWLGRFPVTHAQYMAFVDDNGYQQAHWWAEAQAAGRWQDGHYTWPAPRQQPYDYGARFQLSNLPVIGVSWYEAMAFTKWLTARWHQQGILPPKWQVTLPSEAEWEKAARGGVQIPTQPLVESIFHLPGSPMDRVQLVKNPAPKRSYPWLQADLTPELANYDGSEINQTSSVGCFSAAVSLYGCEEMIGNVFDWTRSLDKPYPYDPRDGREKLERGDTDWTRVRGGSWAVGTQWQRCGARHLNYPLGVNGRSGFRIVLSPFFDSDL